MASAVSALAPHSELQPICLLRKSFSNSRMSLTCYSTVGPVQILIWIYSSLYLLSVSTVVLFFSHTATVLSFSFGPTLLMCCFQFPSQTEGGKKQWLIRAHLLSLARVRNHSYNWNVPVVVETFRLSCYEPEGAMFSFLGVGSWVPWHCQAARSSGMVWAVTCTCSQLSGTRWLLWPHLGSEIEATACAASGTHDVGALPSVIYGVRGSLGGLPFFLYTP